MSIQQNEKFTAENEGKRGCPANQIEKNISGVCGCGKRLKAPKVYDSIDAMGVLKLSSRMK